MVNYQNLPQIYPQSTGMGRSQRIAASLIWNNQTSFLASCPVTVNSAVATVHTSGTGSKNQTGVFYSNSNIKSSYYDYYMTGLINDSIRTFDFHNGIFTKS